MLAPMLEVCPSFEPKYREFLSEWEGEGQLPEYLVLFDLARHLIAMLERGETQAFDAIFDVVERWHIEGDAYVREAASVGLLEDLQNEGLYMDGGGRLFRGAFRPSDFEKWLRPESRRWWFKIKGFWGEGKPLSGD
jgi:hypothetical protein